MPGLKITRELHAEVRETLKENGIMTTAKIHKLSPQTVSRIKRGRSYIGYKRELAADHDSAAPVHYATDEDMPAFETMHNEGEGKLQPRRKGIFERIGLRL